ncbi:MAG: hypothetical protein JSV89_05490 [Spirochaetaceae bacterium]|nr:MAG: hypothetical protein JSV89_05490 [Spirochaetaceae bacterium]
MRTTINLDEDVLEKGRELAARLNKPFRAIINEALRRGLIEVDKPTRQRLYRTKARPLGVRPGINLDNIHELLAQVEGEDHR